MSSIEPTMSVKDALKQVMAARKEMRGALKALEMQFSADLRKMSAEERKRSSKILESRKRLITERAETLFRLRIQLMELNLLLRASTRNTNSVSKELSEICATEHDNALLINEFLKNDLNYTKAARAYQQVLDNVARALTPVVQMEMGRVMYTPSRGSQPSTVTQRPLSRQDLRDILKSLDTANKAHVGRHIELNPTIKKNKSSITQGIRTTNLDSLTYLAGLVTNPTPMEILIPKTKAFIKLELLRPEIKNDPAFIEALHNARKSLIPQVKAYELKGMEGDALKLHHILEKLQKENNDYLEKYPEKQIKSRSRFSMQADTSAKLAHANVRAIELEEMLEQLHEPNPAAPQANFKTVCDDFENFIKKHQKYEASDRNVGGGVTVLGRSTKGDISKMLDKAEKEFHTVQQHAHKKGGALER